MKKLSKSKLEHFEKLLLKKKEELEKNLSEIGEENPDVPGDWETKAEERSNLPSDPNDMADIFEDLENRAAIEDTIEGHLGEIKKALERVEEETYGVCTECGEPINEKRLEAFPSADKCIKHAEK